MSRVQHEILAVKNGQAGKWRELSTQHITSFQKGTNYRRFKTIFSPLGENKPEEDETTPEQALMKSTVMADLSFLFDESFSKLVDTSHLINVTNTVARADVEINGKFLFKGLPVTDLLELDKLVQDWRKVVDATPQLADRGFEPDASQGAHIYKARDLNRVRTAKEKVYTIVAPATPQHPAQVKEDVKDVPTGTIRQSEWSSALSVADLSAMLSKIDDLIAAVKQAIARGNNTEVQGDKISDTLRAYLLGK